jgi:hypothetical protein
MNGQKALRRLRVVRPRPMTLSREFKTELASTESLFGRWSRYCDHLQANMQEAPVVPDDNPSVPSVPPSWADALKIEWGRDPAVDLAWRQRCLQVAKLMNLSQAEFMSATLFDLSPADARWKPIVNASLRACWQCMRLSFHSAMFQHPAIARCPLHRGVLSNRCPKCGAAVGGDLRFAALSPFACRKCGALWRKSVMTAQDEAERTLAGSTLALHRWNFVPLSYNGGRTKLWTASAYAVSRLMPRNDELTVQSARSIARWCVWPSRPRIGWATDLCGCFPIEDWTSVEDAGQTSRPLSMPRSMHAATCSLHRLAELCRSHRLDMALLRVLSGLRPPDTRMPDDASRVALALHLTMRAYGTPARHAWAKCTDEEPYGDIVWNGRMFDCGIPESDQATSVLVQCEIAGYFVWCLLNAADWLWATLTWGSHPSEPAVDYWPAWIVISREGEKLLKVQARTSFERLSRLIRRYPFSREPASMQSNLLTECRQKPGIMSLSLDGELARREESHLVGLRRQVAEATVSCEQLSADSD